MNLSEVTTLRLGGPATTVVEAADERTLIETVSAADASGTPVLIVGGGSNLVVGDEGFDGTVVLVRTRGIEVDADACEGTAVCGGAVAYVAAGEVWDDFVARAVGSQWIGVEALSGIPGSVGATPIQNVGAYGQEVAETIISVRAWDRRESRVRTIMHADCGFGYRSSIFKSEPGRWVVLSVAFQFRLGSLGASVLYAELARELGVEVGARASAQAVRDAVLTLRRAKGMVLDPADHDTWSAGSFFTNPLLTPEQAARLPEPAPRFAQADGTVKTSAAWLIDHAGFAKGHGGQGVSLSHRHVLALTNRGTGTTAELLALAREIQSGVEQAYGIVLEPEPVIVGRSWSWWDSPRTRSS